MSIFNTLTGSEDLPFLGKRGVGLIAALGLCAGMGVSVAQAQEINDQGWSVLEPSVDTRFVFVSSSTGRDTNSGFSPAQAVKSLSYAKSLLRDNSADWMLLKRGDVWNEGIGEIEISGRSDEERLVFTSYGESDERPKMIVSNGPGIGGRYLTEVNNVAIIGLDFEPDPSNRTTAAGISWISWGKNLLVEDCRVVGFRNNVLCTANDNSFENFAIRRSVIADSWNTTGHSQGLLVVRTTGVVIEENVFDHNGWNTGVAEANATMFNQNVYLQKNTTGTEFHGNITARASGAGVQMRRGGNASHNLAYANPIGMRFGYSQIAWPEEAAAGSMVANVVLGGPLSAELTGSGTGIWIERADEALFEENVVAHLGEGSMNWAYSMHDKVGELIFDGNVAFDWGKAIRSTADVEDGVRFEKNRWQTSVDDFLIIMGDLSGVEFEDNELFGFGASDRVFKMEGDRLDYGQWVDQNYVDGDELETTGFPDPGRDLDAYAQHLGLADAEAFLAAAREQSRSNWDSALTGTAASDWIRAGYISED